MKRPKVVVIGGGTGTFTVLSGLKLYPLDLSAIVTMADDGGSTGVLRDELGVLPPGDVRQCLVALSKSPQFLRQLMNYRFVEGGLAGHSFGNLFLSALEKMTGSFDKAVEMAGEILQIEGRVIPSTLNRVELVAELGNGTIVHGQNKIHHAPLSGNLRRIYLEPKAKANPKALSAIKAADLISIGPGDYYGSLIPNLLVTGIAEAIQGSKAIKAYTCNLMTKAEHTANFTVTDYAETMESYLGGKFDYVIYNTKRPSPLALKRYAHEGERFVELGRELSGRKIIGADLVSKKMPKVAKGDPLAAQRTLIRHDANKLAKLIFGIVWQKAF
ncbi:MAG: gluconeogenesis factor YvcK family protein [Patescibacteria group bacterium]